MALRDLVAVVAESGDIVLLALRNRVVAVLGVLIVRRGGGRLGCRGISGLVANIDDTTVAGRRVGRRLGAGGLVLVVVVAAVVVAVTSASRSLADEPLCGGKAASVLVTGLCALDTLSEDVGGETRVFAVDGHQRLEELGGGILRVLELLRSTPALGRALLEEAERVLVTAVEVVEVRLCEAGGEGDDHDLVLLADLADSLVDAVDHVVVDLGRHYPAVAGRKVGVARRRLIGTEGSGDSRGDSGDDGEEESAAHDELDAVVRVEEGR